MAEQESGRRVSHYEIAGELGRGGMGIVYRARDVRNDRIVALKCPWPELSQDPVIRKRFRTEAKAASRILHPHIVTVFEVFEADGSDWMAMELVDGETLSAALRRDGPLPPLEILKHAEALADALRAGHAQGVLHRDVNPKNILIDREAKSRLTDFGLARLTHSSSGDSTASSNSITVSGQIIGTPVYMSPEQALGRPTDNRSDLYSLGAVMYEMCTGAPVFPPGPSGDLLDAILHREPQPIARANYAIPEDLERIVRKCLAKRVDERYQEARELLVDLRALRRKLETSPGEPVKNRRLLWLAGGATAIGMTLLLASLIPSGGTRLPGKARQITAAPGWECDGALSPDGSFIAYVSDESGAPDLWLIDVNGGDPLRLTDTPVPERSPAWLPDGSAILFVSEQGGTSSIWKVPRLGGSRTLLLTNGVDPAVSPDGRQIAFVRPDARGNARIAVAPMTDPSAIRVVTGDGDGVFDHRGATWSPDGKRLCYSDQKDLWTVVVDSGETRRLTSDGAGDMEPVWSSDGKEILFASGREGTLALWRVPSSGGMAQRITLGNGPERSPSISRDGGRLAYSTMVEDPDLILVNLVSGERQRMSSLGVEYNMAIAPGAERIVFVSNRWGTFGLWEQPLLAGRPQGAPHKVTDHPGYAVNPAISPDGRWIAYQRLLGEQRDIWILPSGGGVPVRVTESPGADIQPSWSPDGSRIAFISDREDGNHVWIQPVRDGKAVGAPRRLTGGVREDNAPVWSSDGTRIAYVSVDQVSSEAYVVRVDGDSEPVRVTTGSGAHRVRWDQRTGLLFVSGKWGKELLEIRRVRTSDGQSQPLDPLVDFGPLATIGDFDVSADGTLLVFPRQEVRGDIWLMEAKAGSY